MKILYVEDELTKNIDRLRLLFSHYLDETTIAALKRLEANEYGATPQEIKNLFRSTNIIEIEDRFPSSGWPCLNPNLGYYLEYPRYVIERICVAPHPPEVFGPREDIGQFRLVKDPANIHQQWFLGLIF